MMTGNRGELCLVEWADALLFQLPDFGPERGNLIRALLCIILAGGSIVEGGVAHVREDSAHGHRNDLRRM